MDMFCAPAIVASVALKAAGINVVGLEVVNYINYYLINILKSRTRLCYI